MRNLVFDSLGGACLVVLCAVALGCSGSSASSASPHDAAVAGVGVHDDASAAGRGAAASDASTASEVTDGAASDAQLVDASAADGCSYTTVPAGARKLGIDLLDVNAGETFDDNLARAKAAHASYLTLHLPWTAIETSSGVGDASGILVDPGTPSALAGFEALAQSSGMNVSLTLRPIDATGKTVPADLMTLDFDDPHVVKRFEALVDFVLTRIAPSHLVSLMIGNEVDNFDPAGDTDFWIEYANFLASIRDYVHTKYPGLVIGFTATLPGFTSSTRKTADGWPTQQTLQTWAQQVDVVGVTYYPLNDDFSMRDPSVVAADFDALVASVPAERPIYVQELGYASSATVASSEAQQARFFCEALHAWDVHAARISHVAVLRLNDVSDDKAKELAGPYGVSTPAFTEYLRTLGLRSADGVAKPAYDLLSEQASARGF